MALDDAEGFHALDQAEPLTDGRTLMAVQQDYSTVGQLYREIASGFRNLVDRYGAAEVFLGKPEVQAKSEAFKWPEIVPVSDVTSVDRAIAAIVEQGEGARGEWRTAHFGVFLGMLDELRALRAADPGFEPARPVVPAYVHHVDDADAPVARITDPLTAEVADLFDAIYQAMLMTLSRYFVHTDETLDEVTVLARTARRLMRFGLRPLGIALTRLPVGPEVPGATAGPAFRMVPTTFYTLPHRAAAWHVLRQRLDQIVSRATDLSARAPIPEQPKLLERLTSARDEVAAVAARG
jgi:hypothetical protein